MHAFISDLRPRDIGEQHRKGTRRRLRRLKLLEKIANVFSLQLLQIEQNIPSCLRGAKLHAIGMFASFLKESFDKSHQILLFLKL